MKLTVIEGLGVTIRPVLEDCLGGGWRTREESERARIFSYVGSWGTRRRVSEDIIRNPISFNRRMRESIKTTQRCFHIVDQGIVAVLLQS
jgi:hypothetical protein